MHVHTCTQQEGQRVRCSRMESGVSKGAQGTLTRESSVRSNTSADWRPPRRWHGARNKIMAN